MSVSDENLIAEAEALSAMIHMGEKVSFGQDTAMIDRLVAALRALPAVAPGVKPDADEIESGGKRWHGEDHRVVSVRWEPYKPDGARQMKAKGRWQEQVGTGDYWRWQNCERPQSLAALESPDAGLVAELVEALRALHHAVCGETGFAACVRLDSGKAYPWPALDDADEAAAAALAKLEARA